MKVCNYLKLVLVIVMPDRFIWEGGTASAWTLSVSQVLLEVGTFILCTDDGVKLGQEF